MILSNIKRVYLIGVGGIGMSGLARYFNYHHSKVFGYDKTSTALTKELESEGIIISYEDNKDLIPKEFLNLSDESLIIYTPAIPKDSKILNHFKELGFVVHKRSEVLGIISKGSYTIAVAGTHGKTTTSCMIAHLLKFAGKDCSAFLGGISSNYQTNVLFGKSNLMVVEADEYDRSFLTLHPDIAIITSMDADHLDIYGEKRQLEDSFRLFAGQLKSGGELIHQYTLPLHEGITYGLDSDAHIYAKNIRIKDGEFYFDWISKDQKIENIKIGLPGQHNIENAVAAVKAALMLNIAPQLIREGLASFKGVKRRFDYIVRNQNHIYIDDYAHHPEELRACFKAVRTLFPHRKLTVIFQPHLYSRTRDFADGFSEVLSTADELLLLPIYPARELPIEGVDSSMLLAHMDVNKVVLCGKDEALEIVKNRKPELLLSVGAGDIDQLIEPIKDILDHV